MKITIIALGTEGDVRPLVALGGGLHREGYEVCLATTFAFSDLVRSENLGFSLFDGDFKELMVKESNELKKSGNSPKSMEKSMKRMIQSVGPAWVEQGIAACKDADIIIAGSVAVYLAAALAEILNKPFVQAHLAPAGLVKEIPMAPSPLMNHILHSAITMMLWQPVRPVVNNILRKKYGLRPYPWYGPQKQLNKMKKHILFGMSPNVVPHKDGLPEYIRITGNWILNRAETWRPSQQLLDFLDAGPKPIYIGFGSIPSKDSDKIKKIVLEAVSLSGCRAILSAASLGFDETDISIRNDQIFVIDHVPHDWLFKKVELAVHHGGAGTTAAAIRAGIPSVIVPFFGDQNYWAWCIEQLGVSTKKIAGRNLTADNLADAIRQAKDKQIKEKAKLLGDKVLAEDGIKTAINVLKDWKLI